VSAPHRIRRQRWEVRVPDQATGFAARAQLRAGLEDTLMPALEAAFDAVGSGDEVIRIPRLTVKLKLRNLDELATLLPEQLPALLREQIDAALAGINRESGVVQRTSSAAARRQGLVHYLLSGSLGWQDAQADSTAQAEILREEAQQVARDWMADTAVLQRVLPTSFAQQAAFFFRLLQLLPDALRADWVPAMLDSAPVTPLQVSWVYALRAFRNSVQISALPAHTLLSVDAAALAQVWTTPAATLQSLQSHVAALPGITPALLAQLDEPASGMQAVAPAQSRQRQARPPFARAADDVSAPDSPAAQAHDDRTTQDTPATAKSQAAQEASPAHTAEHRDEPPADSADDADIDTTAGLYVSCAGLVLAHPFIASLLTERGLLDGDAIKPSQLARAAALLHWLACGREEIYEFELGFIKPLLALRPDAHLMVSPGLLDDDDKAECAALLDAMVSHWPALRSTSAEGLRVSFLQRSGLLREIDAGPQQGWQLQPEPEPFDMLLGQLPWGISIVRLPWMTRPIFTDWPTR
jgi:Contractile injection system tape measure protein